MNLRLIVSSLCLGGAVVFATADASAFGFGRLGGCCEPTCCAPEPSCCVAEPSCCVDSCCDPCCEPRRCRLFDGLRGLFKRHNSCCEPACGCEPSCCVAEPSCCAPEPSCCAPEPSCCVAEPSCGCEADCCDPCCQPRRCRLLDGLKSLFHRRGCCEPACCVEPSCGCEPSCAVAPGCGC